MRDHLYFVITSLQEHNKKNSKWCIELFPPPPSFFYLGKERKEPRGKQRGGAGRKAQLIKFLTHWHEDLSFSLQICKNIQVCRHRFVTPAPGRLRQEDPSGGLGSSGPARDPVSKEVNSIPEDDTQGCHLASVCVHICTSTCKHADMHTHEKSHTIYGEGNKAAF